MSQIFSIHPIAVTERTWFPKIEDILGAQVQKELDSWYKKIRHFEPVTLTFWSFTVI